MINSRVKRNFKFMRTSLKGSKVKKKVDRQIQLETDKTSTSRGGSRKDRKIGLQQDVEKLKKRLTHEVNVHRALEQALSRSLGALPCLPRYLPQVTLELLNEVAVLEEEVDSLEEQVVQCRQQLYEESIYISKLENSNEFEEKYPTGDSKSTNPTMYNHQSPNPKFQMVKMLSKRLIIDYMSTETSLDPSKLLFEGKGTEGEDAGKTTFAMQEKGFLVDDGPNKISESILRCLMFAFARLSSTSTLRITEMLPSLESCEEPWAMDFKDPYDIFYEFENTDIGPYKYLHEVEATTINKNTTTISMFLAQRLKILLAKLALVKLTSLTHQEKLAFWINIYNSCVMNVLEGFLEYGTPDTSEGVVQVMHEAKINVGGHLLNAFSIEHFILRLPHRTNYNDEVTARSIFGLEFAEPLVTFALSCGSWSSPAVRVYTGSEVENELEVAKRDYLRAAVGISPTKSQLAIPELLDWYMLDFAKDVESFLEWVCLQLPTEVGKVAMKCLENKMSKPISDCVRVTPYNFLFRYLLYK